MPCGARSEIPPTAFYIKYDEKEAPANIVAFTFTDKAAAELKERIHNRCLRIWVITLSGLRRRVRFVGWQFSSMLPLETKDGEHVGGGIQGSVSSR